MKNDFLSQTVIYNVYPTSFFDSNGDGIGDLKGITQKLPYIRQFADTVWVNPVYKSSCRDGGYDVEDYYAVDPRFGVTEDVRELTDTAHQLGMKVLFDLVVGHTGENHPWFLASRKAERNEYSDTYIWTNNVFEGNLQGMGGITPRDGMYAVNFFCFQPALNYGYRTVTEDWQMEYHDKRLLPLRREVERIISYWLALGVDGFRVDMAASIVKNDEDGKASTEVWREIFGKVRETYPDAFFVSEWGQPEFAVGSGAFDIDFITHCHNQGYNNLCRRENGTNVCSSEGDSYFRRKGAGECDTFFDYLLENRRKVQKKGYISVVSGNHDLPRISMGRDEEELKCAFAFLLSLPTVPLLYYGDEIGMSFTPGLNKDGGYIRTGSRTPMQWTGDRNAGFSAGSEESLYLPVHADCAGRNVRTAET
ncbi:MAG: alpha-amylase family glycosyl hydrolase, partial [Clostridia bacterium]|nr:alpha-amylase family glycosyl hydrolase [Clostridia bacterium]